jgi:hypothetical protein
MQTFFSFSENAILPAGRFPRFPYPHGRTGKPPVMSVWSCQPFSRIIGSSAPLLRAYLSATRRGAICHILVMAGPGAPAGHGKTGQAALATIR